MNSKSKLSLVVLLIAAAGFSFPALAQDEDPLFTSIRKTGEIKVALAPVPPYMTISPSGEAKGALVDLQNLVLKRMGLPALTPAFFAWDAHAPGLQAHQFDYIGAGDNLTEAHCKAFLYTTPTYAYRVGLFTLPGNPKHLTTVAEVARHVDIHLAVLPKSSQEEYALKSGVGSGQLVRVPDVQAGIGTVTGGRADALLVGEFSIVNPGQKGLELVVDEQSPLNADALVFRKENKAFRDAFNKQLVAVIREGAIQELYKKYDIPNGDVVAERISKFTKASDVVPNCE